MNSGTWTDYPPCPFVAVQGNEVRLEGWPMAHDETATEPETMEEPAPRSHPVLPPPLPAMG